MAPPPDDYGWAYIDAQRATASADGPSGSLQFRWGSEDLIPGQFSGSADLVFYPNSTAHSTDGSPDSTTGDGAHNQQSHDMSGSSLYLYGNMYISGAIMAEKYSIREVTATEIDVSGSTIFGDTSDDTHRRTGSLEVSENVIVAKDIHVGNKIKHLGDGETDDHSDTYLDLTNDKAVLRVGSANSTTWYGSDSSGSQNYIMFNGDGVDTDFFIRGAGGPSTTVFNLVASDSDVAAGAQLHISAALGPVTGSGEIHASRFVSNDIFTSGSVHIGGSDPLAQPDEKNDLVIGDHTTPAGKTGNRGMTIASTNTGIGTIRFAPFASANNGEGWIDYSGNTKNMRFGTDGLNTRMTITSTGNVGIGVTDPDTQLEVLGTGTQLKLSYDATNSATLGIDSLGNSTLTPGGGRHTVVAVNQAGAGRVRLDTRLLQIGENNTSDVTIDLRGSTNDLAIVYDESAKTLAFDTSDLFIDAANARVGIGTASPVKMLHVAGSSVHGAAASDFHAFTGDVHLTGALGVKMDVEVAGTMWVANKIAHKQDGEGSGHSDTYFSFTDDQTVLRVGSANSTQWYGSDSSGSQNYVVFNADGVDTDFFIRGASGPSSTVFNLVASDSDVTAGAQLHISAALGPVTGSGEIHASRFVSNDIFTSGSVGIGTSAPLSQPNEKNDLVIGDNTGNRGMTIATAGTGVGTIRFARSANANDGEGWIDYSGNTKKMRFGTDGLNTRMTITSTGDVGINTSSPTCQLDVEGDARFGSVNSGTGSSNVTTFYNTLSGAAAGDGGGDIFANQLYVNDIYLSGTATGITATYVSGTTLDPRSYSYLGWETSGYLKASGSLTVGTNATIGGLLTTQLLKMPDNTALKILVADGNTFQEVAVAGDATISGVSAGTATVTIAADAVHSTMLNDDCISGFSNIAAIPAQADEFLISDGGVLKAITFSQLEDSIFASVSGDATVAAGGAITIAANAVEGSMLNTDVISAQTAMTGDVADTDEVLISDAGTLKRADFSVLRDAVFNDVSGDATVAAGGALTIGSGKVHGGMLNDDLITSAGNALGSAALAQGDKFLFTDVGTGNDVLMNVTFSNLEDSIFGNVSGDATIAAGGALTIAADAVHASMLNDDCISGFSNIAAIPAQADEFLISDTANGALKAITFDQLENSVFAHISGDATVAAGGALTIAAGAVEGSMVADDLISSQTNIGANALAQADEFLVSDNGTLKAITFSNLEDMIFGNVSGDATVASGGALTIAANAVEGSMLNSNVAGVGIVLTGSALTLDLNEVAEVAVNVAADSIAFVDADDSNATKKDTIADLVTAMAGSGLNSPSAGVMGVNVDGTGIEISSDAIRLKDDGVTAAKLNDNIISGQSQLGSATIASADEFLMSDNGTLKAVIFSNLEDSIFASVSGDATIAAGGALTIAADAVHATMLNDDCISGFTNIAAVPAQADEFLISDGGVLKAITFSQLEDSIFASVSGDATVAAGGALTIAAGAIEGSMVNDDLISSQTNIAAVPAQADEFLISDGGVLKAITFSQLEDSVFASVSGDATVAAGGALTIANDAIESGMLNDNVISGQSELAHADISDADELMISDGGTLAKVGVDSLQNHYFGKVSGDATIADGGALTIANDAVEQAMIADDAVGADQIASDAVTNAKIADGAVDTEHMANLAITNALIDNATIRADKLDISNSTDIGEALADDDVMNIGNTSASANRKTAVSRFKTYTKTDIGTVGTAEASKAVILDASKNIATLGTVGCGAITSTGASTFGSMSGSSTVSALGGAHFGGTLTMDGAGIDFNVDTSAGTVNLRVNDGAGADTAITLGKNGKVTKIGDDTPSDGQYLSWDATAGKVAWADGLTVWGMSGSDAHYSSTELRTSGDLAVSGSVTLGGISSGTPASSLFLGLDNNNNIVKAAAGGSWYLEDSDGTEVNITADKEVKFIGSGITTNWTDASHGSDADPYDLTFTVDAAQTGITSILATDLKIGEDDQTKIDFETNDEIHFYAANAHEITLAANTFKPATADGIALGAANAEWSDLFLADGGTIQLGDDQEIQLIHEHDSGLIIKRTRTNDNSPVNLTLQTGETSIEGGDTLGRLQWQAPDEANGGDGATIAASMHVQASSSWNASVQRSSLVWSTADAGELYPWMHLHYDGLLSGSNWTVNVDGTGSYSELDVWNRITCAQQENTKIELTPGKMTLHANTATQPQLTITNTEVVVNEGSSGAQDFRVESNGQTHAFFVDSTDNTAQIKFGGGYGDTGVSIGATGSMNLDGVLHAQSGLETGGDLQVGGNDIKDSGGNVVLSFDGDGNLDNDLTIQSQTAATKLVSTGGESTLYMYGRGASMSSGGNIGGIRFYGTEDDGTGNSAQTSYILAETAESAWAYASSLATRLKFAVGINGSTTLEEVFCLDGSNSDYARVGIGTIDPTYLLSVEVDDGAEYIAQFRQHSSTGYGIRVRNADDSSGRHVTFANDGGTNGGHITMNGTTVAYGTFTGYHPASLPASDHDTGYEYGTIVKIASVDSTTYEKSVDYDVAKTTTAQDKAVLGVWAGKMGECFNDDGTPDRESGKHQIFALGDGHVLVCSEGGNIETGDFICSSNMDGYGMLQPDDLLHNYTVARASEPVDWSTEQSSTKLIACTYHAG